MHLGQWDEAGAYDTAITVGPSPPAAGSSPDWLTAASDFGKQLLQWDYARQINAINLKRAEQGLAPINAPAVQVGIAQGTLTPLLLLGGAALLLIALK
ncbi:MAG: hypothetical protein ACREPG_00180 [Candidatus Binatia bacterium]